MPVATDRKIRKSSFYLDILPEKHYTGFTLGEGWNGWACPLFTLQESLRILDSQMLLNKLVEDEYRYKGDYSEEDDLFRFYEPYENEWYEFRSQTIKGKKLYPIGTRYWTWLEVGPDV